MLTKWTGGFNLTDFTGSLMMVRRIKDSMIPHPNPAAVREFFEQWIAELQVGNS